MILYGPSELPGLSSMSRAWPILAALGAVPAAAADPEPADVLAGVAVSFWRRDGTRRMVALLVIAWLQAAGPAGHPPQPQAPAVENGVRHALQQYAAALRSLDASAVKKVQPSIDVDTLKRAFREMRTAGGQYRRGDRAISRRGGRPGELPRDADCGAKRGQEAERDGRASDPPPAPKGMRG